MQLGRGLSALLGDIENNSSEVPIDKIVLVNRSHITDVYTNTSVNRKKSRQESSSTGTSYAQSTEMAINPNKMNCKKETRQTQDQDEQLSQIMSNLENGQQENSDNKALSTQISERTELSARRSCTDELDTQVNLNINGNFSQTTNDLYWLIKSVRKYGILEPILVTSNIDDTYNLVAGARRYQAARILGLSKVPIRIIGKSNNIDLIYLIENIHRNILNPLDIAILISKYNKEDLSEILCLPQNEIDKYLKLLSLPIHIQELIRHGKITLDVAICMQTLNKEQVEVIVHENWSLIRIKNFVSKLNITANDHPVDSNLILPTKNEEAEEIAKRIENKLKIPTKLSISKKGGALTIICKTYDELNKVIEKFL